MSNRPSPSLSLFSIVARMSVGMPRIGTSRTSITTQRDILYNRQFHCIVSTCSLVRLAVTERLGPEESNGIVYPLYGIAG